MSVNRKEISSDMQTRSLSEISEVDTVRVGMDLVSAARRNIGLMRTVRDCQWLQRRPVILEAIRRYDELWMPLISDLTVGSTPPMVLPPVDVEWVWFCHTLKPVGYRQYCELRFSKLIGKAAIFDEENEEYALMRCREIWERRYPNESFENEIDSNSQDPVVKYEDLYSDVMKQRDLYLKFSAPYVSEIVYLIAARQRYKGFLLILQKFTEELSCFVPTLDIFLMWLTHMVCIFVKLSSKMKSMQEDKKRNFLRLRITRCHRELKLDKPITNFSHNKWLKAWHLYCEFGTRGLVLDLRHRGGYCFKGSKLQGTIAFSWNDLLRAPSVTSARKINEEVRVFVSLTPPVQAPYLLKCVPDRVTDDTGAMISDVILKLNQYRPQEGRWLSRTVLDHAGRECFIVRVRIGGGFWRRGAETPSNVKWDDRIIEIRAGSWSYVAGSIGRAPEKVIATASPKEPPDQWQAAWQFSTGDELMIRWESSSSSSGLNFCLINQTSTDSSVKLLRGRKMEYQVKDNNQESESKESEDDEEEFVTVVRVTEENPDGKATALLNWKLQVVEVQPEEDALLVLLLSVSMLRSISEMTKQDLGSLLIRKRLKEAKMGSRDWGSVILHLSSWPSSSCITSPHLQPWYWNSNAVMARDGRTESVTRQPGLDYSPVEGGDRFYKKGIL
ncbi:uncharacterized protein LOC110815359 isoform X2 [Carica papaya]|uniref:uncharacterized protein LOC110815359 isoform X2 n=1 Tax=Carica papaya TaxID=3649 RepID=UPI000B8D0AFC|nr:uncharacterized protein LOC110815359 isoform X2 [Carica papaya]